MSTTRLGGASGNAVSINDQGVVARYSATAAGVVHATLWRVGVTSVFLDVKPGSSTNPINLASKGKLPVAILSTADFDATEIDVSTILLGDGSGGGTPVATQKKGQQHASVEDVDGDGLVDVMLHFELAAMIANGDLGVATVELCVSGQTGSGGHIEGCDRVDVK